MPEDSHHLPRRYSGGLVFLSEKVSWRAAVCEAAVLSEWSVAPLSHRRRRKAHALEHGKVLRRRMPSQDIFPACESPCTSNCPKVRATNGTTLTARLGELRKSQKTAKLAVGGNISMRRFRTPFLYH